MARRMRVWTGTEWVDVISSLINYKPEIAYSATAPVDPQEGDFWLDITKPTAPVLKSYNGTEWIISGGVSDSVTTSMFLGGM